MDIAHMSNEYNMAMLDKQINEQWEMWKAQNEYNSPAAQRQRLEAAGYNPYMNQDGGTASSMTAPAGQPAVTPTMVGATMQPGLNGLEAFLGTVQGITELLGSYTQNRLGAEQISGQSISNYIVKQSALSEIQMRRSNAAIAGVTARNEETRQNLNIAAQNLSNEAAYQSIYGHAVQNMRASMELSALPQQLQLGIAHLAADLKLKYQQGEINDKQLDKLIAEIRNIDVSSALGEANIDYVQAQTRGLNTANRFAEDTYDTRVAGAEAETASKESNQGANNPWQLVQDFIRHFVKEDNDLPFPFTIPKVSNYSY